MSSVVYPALSKMPNSFEPIAIGGSLTSIARPNASHSKIGILAMFSPLGACDLVRELFVAEGMSVVNVNKRAL